MEDIACIFCNLKSDKIVIEENGYQGRQCEHCNLIYVSPRPSLSELGSFYRFDHAHVSAGTHIFGAFRRRIIARYMLRIIRRFAAGGSLLEIGSGSGYFLDEARKQGFDVYGIELNEILYNFMREELGIACACSPLDESLFGGRKFDIIYHRDVISHFHDPIEEFKKMHERLAGGGLVIFETGNLGDVDPKYYKLFSEFQFPDHLFFFSENNLRELLRLTGFSLVKIYGYAIVPQLKILGGIDRFVGSVSILKKMKTSMDTKKKEAAGGASVHEGIQSSWLKQAARNVYNYLYYTLRYKVGRFMPKKARPQTLVVVVRKKKS